MHKQIKQMQIVLGLLLVEHNVIQILQKLSFQEFFLPGQFLGKDHLRSDFREYED